MARRTGPTFIQRSRQKAPAEKAAFHQISGAGRSRVRRPFFGLSPTDEAAVIARFEAGLDRLIRAAR